MPTEKASLTYKDSDMDANELGGEVKITKARNEFDIDSYAVYFGTDEKTKLEVDGQPVLLGEVSPIGRDTEFRIHQNTPLPGAATHLLVFSKNSYGEFSNPGNAIVKDAVLPRAKPTGIAFEDEDGEKGEVGGTLNVNRAEDENQIDEYSVHWGRTPTRKISSGSLIRDIPKQANMDVSTYIVKNTKIPDTASYLLAFSKNAHGEHPSPVSIKIVDRTKPCLQSNETSCPRKVTINHPQATITFERAAQEAGLTHYAVYWGRSSCKEGGQSGAKNGHIKDVDIKDPTEVVLAQDSPVPDGTTHILVFSKNKYGESEFCVSDNFDHATSGMKGEL